jgi:tetratricopeptide (TPR) repeat protein
MSRAHRLLFDWEGVIDSLEQRRAVLTGSRARPQKYSEDETAIFEAQWWRDCNRQVFRPTLKRVLDKRAPSLHRLQMSVLALVVADNQCLKADAEAVIEVVDSLSVNSAREDLERLKAQVIYHTAFGSLDRAVVEGARLVELERRSGNSAGHLRALRWLSVPLRRTNKIEAAVAALTQAYEHAARLNLRGEMWNAAFYVEGVALDCEDLELALEWAPTVVALDGDATLNSLRGSDHRYTQARIEFMRGNYDVARKYLEESRSLKRTTPAARGEQSLLSLDVLLRARGEARRIPGAMLRRLRTLHVRTRESGVRDFEAAAVVAGLLHEGDRAEAKAIFEYYVSIRRSRIQKHTTLDSVRTALALGAD